MQATLLLHWNMFSQEPLRVTPAQAKAMSYSQLLVSQSASWLTIEQHVSMQAQEAGLLSWAGPALARLLCKTGLWVQSLRAAFKAKALPLLEEAHGDADSAAGRQLVVNCCLLQGLLVPAPACTPACHAAAPEAGSFCAAAQSCLR